MSFTGEPADIINVYRAFIADQQYVTFREYYFVQLRIAAKRQPEQRSLRGVEASSTAGSPSDGSTKKNMVDRSSGTHLLIGEAKDHLAPFEPRRVDGIEHRGMLRPKRVAEWCAEQPVTRGERLGCAHLDGALLVRMNIG
jgi:hypothetical protein